MNRNIEDVLARMKWMRDERIWPNGLRYLWTDAFGVTLLMSLHNQLQDVRYLAEAEWVVDEVDRVLVRGSCPNQKTMAIKIWVRIGRTPQSSNET